MFSVLTGLRWADVHHLCWEDVKGNDVDGWYLQFKQGKTKDYLVLPLTSQARDLVGDPKAADERVFHKLTYGTQTGQMLTRWAMRAGIPKKITFHSARHATLTGS